MVVCRQRGERYGLDFGDLTWLSNSRLALETAEFARDQTLYHPIHQELFTAYFSRCEDIGDREVLQRVVRTHGLDPTQLDKALDEGTYSMRVSRGSQEARQRGVTAIPAFFIEDRPVITGAVSEEVFRAALQEIQQGIATGPK